MKRTPSGCVSRGIKAPMVRSSQGSRPMPHGKRGRLSDHGLMGKQTCDEHEAAMWMPCGGISEVLTVELVRPIGGMHWW
jgi:hypothetical protein